MIDGRLELVFAPHGDRTVLAHTRAAAPLKIVRPFALDDGRVVVQMLTLGPGLCAGDHCSIDVIVEPGAKAIVIAQAASRILGMPDGMHASQDVRLRVRAGGQLEYFPGLTIPFPGSRFVQRVSVETESGARVGIIESWAMGRLRRGEYLEFRGIRSETMVRLSGTPIYTDVIDLEPASVDVAAAGILDRYRYVATGFWYGATLPSAGAETRFATCRAGLETRRIKADLKVRPTNGETLVAFGQAAPDQVYLRVLADEGYGLGKIVQTAVGFIHAGWHMQPIPIHRFTA